MVSTAKNPEGVLKGVIDGRKKDYNVKNVTEKFQVIIFYPSDWDDDSHSLLSSFSSKQFPSSVCVYGCSTDCIGSHQDWIKTMFGSSLSFPLLSDPSGQLASTFSLFDWEERMNLRAVVITDNQGKALEVVNTSMEDDQKAAYVLNLVQQLKQQPSSTQSLSNTRCHSKQASSANPDLAEMVDELLKYSLSVFTKAHHQNTTGLERLAKVAEDRQKDLAVRSKIVHFLFRATERLVEGL